MKILFGLSLGSVKCDFAANPPHSWPIDDLGLTVENAKTVLRVGKQLQPVLLLAIITTLVQIGLIDAGRFLLTGHGRIHPLMMTSKQVLKFP